MKHKIRFPGKLLSFRRGKNIPRFIAYYPPPGSDSGNGSFWREHKYAIIIFILAVALMLTADFSYGQPPLKVGGRLPDIRVGKVLNGTGPELDLADYRDKLLILDFWSTSCMTCIEDMPAVAALQKRFASRLVVIDIDYEQEQRVLRFYERRPELKALAIPVVVKDTLFKKLFPHRYEPHLVWIDHGVFRAATEGDYFTAANVDSILNKRPAVLREKSDPAVRDPGQALFTAVAGQSLEPLSPVYASTFTGFIRGIAPCMGKVVDTANGTDRYYLVNQGILGLYAYVFDSPLPFRANRRILSVRDSGDYLYNHGVYADQWDEQHVFSFEITVPAGTPVSEVRQQVRQSLDTYLGLRGEIVARDVDCLALRQTGKGLQPGKYARSEQKLKAGGAAYMRRTLVRYLAARLNSLSPHLPVVDETGFTDFTDIELPGYSEDIADWPALLKNCGLELVPCRRRLDLFVLTESGRSPMLPQGAAKQTVSTHLNKPSQ